MTTPIVPSITDEQLVDLEMHADLPRPDEIDCDISFGELRGLIARLRAAEKDAARYRRLRAMRRDIEALQAALKELK